MRYWIYWNDLVQGPFELDELTTLKALTEDLPVCLEDRTDWLPACRIADLAPIIEERRSSRMPPLPPPPPPTGRPASVPLQGEFFTEAPNQKWLFPNSDPSKGPFALSESPFDLKTVYPDVSFTTPIHFSAGNPTVTRVAQPSASSVLTLDRPETPAPDIYLRNAPEVFASRMSPVLDLKEEPEPVLSSSETRIPLEIYPDAAEEFQEAAAKPFPPLSLDTPEDRSTLRVASWVGGLILALLAAGTLAYKWFDSSTSRAAINEAKKHTPAVNVGRQNIEKINLRPLLETKPVALVAKKNKIIRKPTKKHTVTKPATTLAPAEIPAPREIPKPPEPPKRVEAADPWKDRQKEATSFVMNKKLSRLHQTVAERAQSMAEAQNQKVSWDALQIAGPLYRVSLIFSSGQTAVGGSFMKLYPFTVDLKHHTVSSDDAGTSADILKAKKKIAPATSPALATPAGIPTEVPVTAPTVTAAAPSPSPLPSIALPPTTPSANEKPDAWKDRFNEAIALVTNKKLSTTGQTVGERARIMLEGMHDKELLYAADSGSRLYLPDKMAWSALREAGAAYRVYLGFSADQANGERIQSQSYQFQANLEHKTVVTDDTSASADFLTVTTPLIHKRDPRAMDIENIMSAVDLLNKHLMRAIIIKDNRKNRLEEKNISAAIKTAMQRFQRAVIYFRTKYPDTMLQNVAKAYAFTKLLKDHV